MGCSASTPARRPVTPIFTWADSRSAPRRRARCGAPSTPSLHDRTGCHLLQLVLAGQAPRGWDASGRPRSACRLLGIDRRASGAHVLRRDGDECVDGLGDRAARSGHAALGPGRWRRPASRPTSSSAAGRWRRAPRPARAVEQPLAIAARACRGFPPSATARPATWARTASTRPGSRSTWEPRPRSPGDRRSCGGALGTVALPG